MFIRAQLVMMASDICYSSYNMHALYRIVTSYLPQFMAEIVYRSGFTAELSGRTKTAIQADTSGDMVAPPSAANPIKMMGTYEGCAYDNAVCHCFHDLTLIVLVDSNWSSLFQ